MCASRPRRSGVSRSRLGSLLPLRNHTIWRLVQSQGRREVESDEPGWEGWFPRWRVDMTLWDAAAQACASDRWAECAVHWNTAMTAALLSAAAISPDSVVLDLAAGSGDPALTIAECVIRGRVIALDSSLAGLLLAGTHARRLGLGAKVTFVQADAEAIPLAANCVDRITCRCGIMFFSDTALVMSEVLRVLK